MLCERAINTILAGIRSQRPDSKINGKATDPPNAAPHRAAPRRKIQ